MNELYGCVIIFKKICINIFGWKYTKINIYMSSGSISVGFVIGKIIIFVLNN